MNTEIEHLADNNVRLTITVPEADFETSIDKAFKTLARQVRLPGFRPGKAPRKILEKHIGYEAGRAQALNDYLPQYYVDAVDENDIDPIDYPELKINAGEESGDVIFEATVAVRPTVTVSGYDKLEVVLDTEEITDEAIDKQVDSLRDRHAELQDSQAPISEGAYATLDIAATIDGEAFPGLSANDYLYNVGSGIIVAELDENLTGKSVGDEVTFTAELPEAFGEVAGQEAEFSATVKGIQTKELPEATDEWIKENTDFETLAAYRDDVKTRMGNLQKLQAQMQVQQKVMESLASVVSDEIPDSYMEKEIDARINSIAQQSGVNREILEQYLEEQDEEMKEEFFANVRKDAETSVKSDLALRAIILQESLDATDAELEEEIEKFAQSSGEKINKIRNRVSQPGVEKQLRLDIARNKAVKFVTDNAVGKDSQGNDIELQLPSDGGDDIAAMANMISSMSDHDHEHDHDHDHDDHNH